MANGTEAAAAEEQKKRHRSPNYPTVGLREAVDRIKKFYTADGKAGATADVAARHIGFQSAHGTAHSTLAALKKFGLVEDRGGRIVPTARALEIIALRDDDPRRQQALRDAAISPPIYLELIEEYRQTGLPADDTLEGELVAYKSFNPKAVKAFVADFRDSLEFAGLSDFSVLSSEATMNTQEIKPEAASPSAAKPLPSGMYRTSEGAIKVGGPAVSRPDTNTFVWPLSKEVAAQVTFTGGRVKAAHLDILAKYLQLAKSALEVEEEDPEEKN